MLRGGHDTLRFRLISIDKRRGTPGNGKRGSIANRYNPIRAARSVCQGQACELSDGMSLRLRRKTGRRHEIQLCARISDRQRPTHGRLSGGEEYGSWTDRFTSQSFHRLLPQGNPILFRHQCRRAALQRLPKFDFQLLFDAAFLSVTDQSAQIFTGGRKPVSGHLSLNERLHFIR